MNILVFDIETVPDTELSKKYNSIYVSNSIGQ